jgi:hypothetical protein
VSLNCPKIAELQAPSLKYNQQVSYNQQVFDQPVIRSPNDRLQRHQSLAPLLTVSRNSRACVRVWGVDCSASSCFACASTLVEHRLSAWLDKGSDILTTTHSSCCAATMRAWNTTCPHGRTGPRGEDIGIPDPVWTRSYSR